MVVIDYHSDFLITIEDLFLFISRNFTVEALSDNFVNCANIYAGKS
jgi:hypothetical protein